MTLKLKEGWEIREDWGTEKRWVLPTGGDLGRAYAVIEFNREVRVFPFGKNLETNFVGTVEQAHEYLLNVGSDSPWEEI